ncbi:MAG: CoA-acylating methylmalonate-semialdehyde dehydrogenase [Vicinamibacteria bacterium]|nr:CoA-acylating methylmalonate-semialdehyde dehydrogenase [Vicinamibacteria bacterium]
MTNETQATRELTVVNHWIGGKHYAGPTERWGDVFNPATGESSTRVAFASEKVVDEAVKVAAAAQKKWGAASLAQRTRVMFAFRQLLEKHKVEMAALITREHGKVASDALGEVNRGLEVVEFACGLPQLLKGEFSENVSTDVDSYSIRQALGVVAGITPFNFPAMVPMWMYPLAIACGNAFILKPSEKDPSAANFSAKLLREAGLPAGVFSVVHGDKLAVAAILHHPGIAAVSFVGSTPIARYIYETGTRAGKRVQALGGAKNHMVVLPDADMDLAADSAVSAGFGSAGERCMAISALVAVGDAAERLLPKIQERMAKLKVGPGNEAGADMGPLVTREHHSRVKGYVDKGESEGARLLVDGRTLKVKGHEDGYFLGPCLFDQVTRDMNIYKDEIFGPVLSVVRAKTYDEALGLVNDNPWANGVAIFTNDGGAARRFQNEVQVGMVGINVPIPVPMAYYSFGGWKSSLFGDSHVHGKEGVHFYTRGKVVTSRWPQPHHRGVNLGFPQMK